MMRMDVRAVLLLMSFAMLCCNRQPKHEAAHGTRADRMEEDSACVLKHYSLGGKPSRQLRLQRELDEVSGLAASADGRLFAHDDERGVVYRLDPGNGTIRSWFTLGRTVVLEDFEGLAIAEGYFYLVTSDGTLFRFREGEDGSRVAYDTFGTRLGRSNDVEGLCYDPETRSLLLACKESPGRGFKGKRAVYAWSIDTQELAETPRFLIDEAALVGKKGSFRPSAIERITVHGGFVILSSRQKAVLEIDAEGKILAFRKLKAKQHPQPEGIAVLPTGELLITDEASTGPARLSVYHQK